MLMYQRIVLTLVIACLVALPGLAKPVTVMSYNVENMLDVFDDPYTADEGTDVKRRDEIKTIAKANADIIVFQELENEHLLQGMVATFLPEAGYHYIACQRTNSKRGINLGVISRYPIKRLTSYRFKTLTHPDVDPSEQTWRFARDVMHIVLNVKGRELHVFNAHLKSNSNRANDPHSSKWRTSEAIAIKGIIRKLHQDKPDVLAVLMGDMNSNIETRPEQDRPWPATAHFRKPEADGTQLLNDAHNQIKDYDKRITIPGSGKYPPAIFDYIYASPKLHTMLVKGSAKVINQSALTTGSDHYPVYATYEIGK